MQFVSRYLPHVFLSLLLCCLLGLQTLAQTTYYSANGATTPLWTTAGTWTTSPTGGGFPGIGIPTLGPGSITGGTGAGTDNVVILNGHTVFLDYDAANIRTLGTVEIRAGGTLIIRGNGPAANIAIGTLQGSGTLRVNGVVTGAYILPAVTNADNFVATTGGTIDFFGTTSATLPVANLFGDASADNYNHLTLSGTVAHNKTLAGNLTVSGNLTVDSSATFVIGNDNTARTINLTGNLVIGAGSTATNSITCTDLTGGQTVIHQLNIAGNYVHNGTSTARFTTMTAQSNVASPTNDAHVLVVANNTAADQSFVMNGPTVFWRVQLTKGIDRTYVLNLDANNEANFRILGPTIQITAAGTLDAQVLLGTVDNTLQLEINSGTLRIGSNILMDGQSGRANFFTEGQEYRHDRDAGLWLDGGTISFTDNGIYNFGYLRLSAGSYTMTGAADDGGIRFSDDSQVLVEGGTHQVHQIRTSNAVGSGFASWTMTGGTINIVDGGFGAPNNAQGIFGFRFAASVFQMSGGVVNISTQSGFGTGSAVDIQSGVGNFSVTGGTININIPAGSGATFGINSVVPLWNLNVTRGGAGATTGTAQLFTSGLTVQNDLTITNPTSTTTTAVFVANNLALTVGRNLDLGQNAAVATDILNMGTGTLSFTGTNRSRVYNRSATLDTQVPTFAAVTINKDSDTARVEFISTRTVNATADFEMTGLLTLTRGTFDYGSQLFSTTGSVTVGASTASAMGPASGSTGRLILAGTAAQTITMPYGSLTTWGNLEINNTFGTAPQVTLSTGDITSMQNLTMTTGILDLGINGLRLENEVTLSGAAFSATKHIRMSGLASDGGLAIFKNAVDASILYPIGTNANATNRYLPVTLNLSAITGSGYIQVSMADVVLATLNGSTAANTLSLYWRVRTSAGITAATGSYTMQGIASDFPGGAIPGAGYASGYTVSAARNLLVNVATDAVDGAGLITYSSHTLPSDGNYTTADANAIFTGTAKIYYSRGGGAMNWTTAATWTSNQVCVDCTIPNVHDSAINPQDGGIPGAGDIVVIGYDPTPSDNPAKIFYQGVAGTISAAELQFTPIPTPVIIGTDDWGDRPFFQIRNATTPTAAFGKVSGQGIFAIGIYNGTNGPTLTGIDFGDFNDTEGSVFLIQAMDNGAFTNVHSYPAGTAGGPTTFPDLRTYSGAYDDATIEFTSNLTTNFDMQVSGGARIRMNNGAAGNFTIARDLRMYSPEPGNWPLYTGAAIFFQATGTARTISVGRDILFETSGVTQDSSQIFVDSTTVGTLVHTLNVGRNITQTSTNSKGLALWSANTNRASVDLVLNTTQNGVISRVAGGISQKPKLGRLTLNKGTSIASTATVSTVFTLNGTTNGATKALTLTNGMLLLNPSATNALVLSTDGVDFTIPSTAGLSLQNNVNATITNAVTDGSATGITLNGALILRGNSTLTMTGDAAGTITVSTITYGGSGTALFDYGSTGASSIDGQIRRSATSTAGALKFRQSAGTLNLGGNVNAAGARTGQADDRGVFDLENNTGSSFTMSGGTLAITRRRNGTTPELYLYAPNDTITGGTINIGDATTPASSTIRVQTDKTIPALTVVDGVGTDATATVAQVQVENLAISGNLTVQDNARFDPNSRNITVQGNLSLLGVGDYNSGATTHTLTLSGTSATEQSIVVPTTATATFSSLTINKTNATGGVNFTGGTATSFTVANDLTITDGTLNINGTVTTLNVAGNIVNSDSTAGAGYIVTTKAATPIPTIGGTGTGRFTNLRIGNAVGAQFTANQRVVGNLDLTSGILDLGTNRLDLTSAATVTGTFSATRYINTSGTLLAAGIRKLVAVGQADFTIPVGSGGFYTPFRYDNAGSTETTGGFLQIRPINSINLTTTNTGNNDVLNYYWNVTPGGSIAFTALRFDFGAPTTKAVDIGLNLYRTGYIFSGAGSWLKGNAPPYGTFPNNGVEQDVDVDGSASVGRVRFSFGSTVNAGLVTSMSSTTPHDFTAGDGTTGTGKLESVLTYYSMAPGNFEDNTPGQWSTTSHAGPACGTCSPSLVSPELGGASSVRINHAITFTSNNDAAFDLTFTSAAGSLNVGAFNGFNLGKVSGTGRLIMQPSGVSANLPDGDYSDFRIVTGGTFEFGGTGNYTLPDAVSMPTMNNVVVSGASGTKSLAAGTTTILGNLTVGETGTPTLVLGSNTLVLNGNLTHTAGTLTATGSTITLSGTAAQTIDALNVGGTTLNNLTVNNSAGLNIGAAATDSVMVNGTLTFTSGLVNTGGARGILRLGTAANISPAATTLTTATGFVNGPIQKKIFSGGSFIFPTGEVPNTFVQYRPIGIQNTSQGRVWTAEFNGSSHPNAGTVTTPLVLPTGANREWWSVNDNAGAGATTAQVRIYWGTGSNVSTGATVANFRVAKLNGTSWEMVASTVDGGSAIASGSVFTSTNTSFSEQFFTLGSETTPLPVTWLSFTGRFVGKHADLNWVTSQEINNERFEVERSLDGSNFAQVGTLPGAGTISYPQYYGYTDFDAPIINKLYYRLRQVDFDGQSGYSPTIELARLGGEAAVRYWTLYPNPTTGDNFSVVRINPDVNLEDSHTLQVIDLYGNLLASHTGTLEAANQGLRATVNGLRSGLYLIQISSKGKLQSERLIKK